MVVTYFQSLGKAKQAGVLVMLRQLVLVIPLVLTMPLLLGGDVLGVWLALPLNDVNSYCGDQSSDKGIWISERNDGELA